MRMVCIVERQFLAGGFEVFDRDSLLFAPSDEVHVCGACSLVALLCLHVCQVKKADEEHLRKMQVAAKALAQGKER